MTKEKRYRYIIVNLNIHTHNPPTHKIPPLTEQNPKIDHHHNKYLLSREGIRKSIKHYASIRGVYKKYHVEYIRSFMLEMPGKHRRHF